MRRMVLVGALVTSLMAISQPAAAHPLGNFTTNQYVGLHAGDVLAVDYVVDMAEIPAFQERAAVDVDSDGVVTATEARQYAVAACRERIPALNLTSDDAPVPMLIEHSSLEFLPGQGGLSTLRLECRANSAVGIPDGTGLSLRNDNFTERLGWKEVVATGVLPSEIPAVSVTDRLRSYPTELLSSPVRVDSALFVVDRTAATVETPMAPTGSVRTPDPLSSLLSGTAPPTLVAGVITAVVLGIGHALAPGHGKTIMGALLVGTNAKVRHAFGLAGAVAFSHTIGVLALALVTLVAARTFPVERLFPYLSAVSGLLVIGVGLWLIGRTLARRRGWLSHRHRHLQLRDLQTKSGWKLLAAIGVSGGLAPSASAVVLLLGSVAVGRVEYGLLVITAFGIGMAVTLVVVSLVLLTAARFGRNLLSGSGRFGRLWQWAPVAMGVVISVGGVAIALRALTQIGAL